MKSISLMLDAAAAWYLAAAVQALFHRWFGHSRRLPAVHAAHALGHHLVYRRDQLLQERWQPSERQAVGYYAWPVAAIACVVGFLCDWRQFMAFATGTLASLVWHVWLHRHYHSNSTWLVRFGWFRRKRALHFEHHFMARSNYAISEFWIDRLTGSWRAPRTRCLRFAARREPAAGRVVAARRLLEP